LNDLTVSEMLILLLLADIIAKQGAASLVFPSSLGKLGSLLASPQEAGN
jgi:hypothetical protein